MEYRVRPPVVLGITRKVNKPRLTNIMGMLKAKSKPITIWEASDIPVDENQIGLSGSPTQPGEIKTPDMSRSTIELQGSPEEIAEAIIQKIVKAGIRV